MKDILKEIFCYYMAALNWVLSTIMCLTVILIPLWLCLFNNYMFWNDPYGWWCNRIF